MHINKETSIDHQAYSKSLGQGSQQAFLLAAIMARQAGIYLAGHVTEVNRNDRGWHIIPDNMKEIESKPSKAQTMQSKFVIEK